MNRARTIVAEPCPSDVRYSVQEEIMTPSTEYHATTVDEAVDKAAIALGLNRDEVSYSILDSGSSGFMGLGARDARILVDSVEKTDLISEVQAIFTSDSEDNTEPETTREDSEIIEDELELHVKQELEERSELESRPLEDDGSKSPASAEVLSASKNYLEELTASMGFDCEIELYDSDEVIAADVSCEEAGLFIGHKGETIDSIQYLLNVVVYRNREYEKKIVVDCEGYRRRRIEAVQGIARRTARKSVREHRPLKLPPMNSSERRAVHVFLRDDPGVMTSSEGEDDNRRVVIKPV